MLNFVTLDSSKAVDNEKIQVFITHKHTHTLKTFHNNVNQQSLRDIVSNGIFRNISGGLSSEIVLSLYFQIKFKCNDKTFSLSLDNLTARM